PRGRRRCKWRMRGWRATIVTSSGSGALALQGLHDLARGVRAGEAGDAAARVRAGPAQEQVFDRRAVPRPSEERPHREQLIESRLAVEDVAAGQAVAVLEVL